METHRRHCNPGRTRPREETSDKLSLRRAIPDDRQAVLGVREACIRDLAPEYYTRLEVRRWLDAGNAEGTLDRLERGRLWAGFYASELVGYCCGAPGEIEGLFVHPEYQGLGFGKRLLSKAEEPSLVCRSPAIVVLSTHGATPFYRAQGYRYVTVVTFRFPTGFAIEAHRLEKILR